MDDYKKHIEYYGFIIIVAEKWEEEEEGEFKSQLPFITFLS